MSPSPSSSWHPPPPPPPPPPKKRSSYPNNQSQPKNHQNIGESNFQNSSGSIGNQNNGSQNFVAKNNVSNVSHTSKNVYSHQPPPTNKTPSHSSNGTNPTFYRNFAPNSNSTQSFHPAVPKKIPTPPLPSSLNNKSGISSNIPPMYPNKTVYSTTFPLSQQTENNFKNQIGTHIRPPPTPPPPPMQSHLKPMTMPPNTQLYPPPTTNFSSFQRPPPPPPMVMNKPNSFPSNGTSPSQTYQQQPPPKATPKTVPKINPSQIPRPPSFNYPPLQKAQIYRTKYSFDSSNTNPTAATTTPPPMSSSRYITIDDGNASPRFLRCSTHSFPKNASTQSKTGIPVSLLCTPMAVQHHYHSIYDDDDNDFDSKESSESIPPLLNGLVFKKSSTSQIQMDTPPLKCKRCHAYINSFVKWNQQRSSSSGYYNSYECIFCGTVNTVAESPPMPALKKGTVEYLVNGSYIASHNLFESGNGDSILKRNVHLYALDCSTTSKKTLFHLWNEYLNCLTDVAERLNDVFDEEMKCRDWSLCSRNDLNDQYKPRVGFCFILPNDTIAIPYVAGDQKDLKENVKLAIMSDVHDDPFAPLPISMWTYDVTSDTDMKAMHFIMSIVPMLIDVDDKTIHEGSCGGSALVLMANALNESGGRGTLITTSRPNRGVGKLHNRGKRAMIYKRPLEEHNASIPIQLLNNKNGNDSKDDECADFYRSLAQSCHESKVSMDIIVISSLDDYVDAATLGEFCRSTCGKLKIIPDPKIGTLFQESLRQELIRSATRTLAYDAIFKLRFSSGVGLKSFINPPGKVFDNGLTEPELEMSSVSSDTCICAVLEHKIGGIKGKMENKLFTYIQSVLLYTSPFGQRKLKVSTLALPVTDRPQDVFRCADFGCISALLTREAVVTAIKYGIQKARMEVFDSCLNILSMYRKHTSAKNSSLGQLVLPEALQLLPLYCMSIRKSGLLRPALPQGSSNHPQPSIDERMLMMFQASNVSSSLSMLLVHPNIYDLSQLKGREGFEYTPKSVEREPFSEESCTPYIHLPTTCHPSITVLEDDGIYLLDDGFSLYLYIGKSVSDVFLLEVFGESYNSNETTSEYGERVKNVIKGIRRCCSSRSTYAPIIVYEKRDNQSQRLYGKITSLLVDDPTTHEKGYVDFLCLMHQKIKKILES